MRSSETVLKEAPERRGDGKRREMMHHHEE